MNLRNLTLSLVLFVALASLFSSVLPRLEAQAVPSADLDATTGFRALATRTLSIASDAATIMGTLPVGVHTVEVIVLGGDVNYGDSTLTTDTSWPYIASGSIKTFTGITSRNPTIYFRPRGARATATVGLVAR